MPLDLSVVKRQLQDHLQEGLLLVVGSGLSIAEGIPSMGQLAEHLKEVISPHLVEVPDPAWGKVVVPLNGGDHLEAAMGKADLKTTTVDMIVDATARFIHNEELKVFSQVISGVRTLPFTGFVKHLFKGGRKFHLITPNYDRLIELATEAAGIGVDTRFAGNLFGLFDPKRSADAHRESYLSGKQKHAAFRPTAHLCVHKPHGSLDWFEVDRKVVKCPMYVGKPMIITPGGSKYRTSFQLPFDDQRTSGNRAVDNSTRLMFMGYGFNDEHLEQHLCPDLKLTKPSVIVTRTLSENARKAVVNSVTTQVIALSAVSENDSRTQIMTSAGEELVVDEQLWHLDGFNEGVIQ